MNNIMQDLPEISVIIPAYNEGEGIERALRVICNMLDSSVNAWEIVVIDDGSRDNTFQQICNYALNEPRVKGISFSRNFGKEAALLAGLRYASGSAVIIIDADLQHPPELIPDMITRWRTGTKIVHAIKRRRESDSIGKRLSAWTVNQIISKLGGINIYNSSDFKLLDRVVVDILVYRIRERERFFRGLSSWIGFSQEYIEFDVSGRVEDESKWSAWSLAELAITALTSFTSFPLRIITFLGVMTLILGFGVAGDALWSWYHGVAVSGFATIIITFLILGSFIMISLGIIGEYIAKMYQEIKARPAYLVQSIIGFPTFTSLLASPDSHTLTSAAGQEELSEGR